MYVPTMYHINRNIFYRHANLLKVIFLEVNAQPNQKYIKRDFVSLVIPQQELSIRSLFCQDSTSLTFNSETSLESNSRTSKLFKQT